MTIRYKNAASGLMGRGQADRRNHIIANEKEKIKRQHSFLTGTEKKCATSSRNGAHPAPEPTRILPLAFIAHAWTNTPPHSSLTAAEKEKCRTAKSNPPETRHAQKRRTQSRYLFLVVFANANQNSQGEHDGASSNVSIKIRTPKKNRQKRAGRRDKSKNAPFQRTSKA
jgi:hypothetical protein